METHNQKEGSLPGTLCLKTSFLLTGATEMRVRHGARSMVMKRRHSAAVFDQSSPDAVAIAQAHLAHIAVLRGARLQHRAITNELRTYFEAVATEAVPDQLLNSLNEPKDE
jgi:hypothetical protein